MLIVLKRDEFSAMHCIFLERKYPKREKGEHIKNKYGVTWQIVPNALGEISQGKDDKKSERGTGGFERKTFNQGLKHNLSFLIFHSSLWVE